MGRRLQLGPEPWHVPLRMDQVTICGVGLIGGSLALAVRERGLAKRIVGVDHWAGGAPPAFVDEAVSASDAAACRRAVSTAELIVLAMPVCAIQAALPWVLDAAAAGALVTDCGSTKRAIVEVASAHAARERFVPGHPMAGHPETGRAHARADLFVGRRWLLCPRELSSQDASERVTSVVRALGAEPVVLTAAEHDQAVALTSHVPQLVASALTVLASETGADAASGPGFASATRVAGGAESMWRDIFASNGDAVASALRRLGARLGVAAEALARDPADPEAALELLARARALRERDR